MLHFDENFAACILIRVLRRRRLGFSREMRQLASDWIKLKP